MKYKSKRIRDMTPDELVMTCNGLSLKTCVITGWTIPDSNEYVRILDEQLRKFLVDEYMNINVDEFEYAMRVYGTQIKDWGKSLNLSLIREGLDAYLAQRAELSKIEEQTAIKPAKIEGPKDTDWSDTWEKLIKGEITGIYSDLVPYPSIYDWAVKTGLYAPTKGIKWGWINKARIEFIKEVDLKRETFRATHDEKELSEMMKVPTWDKNERVASALIASAKTIAVKEWIEKEKPSQ